MLIDQEARQAIYPLLSEDEKLIWAGRPETGLVTELEDAIAVPFGVFWLAFVIFWIGLVLFSDAPFWFAAFGLPFLGVGIYFLVGRFYFDAFNRRETVYGITNRRVIVRNDFLGKSVESIDLGGLPHATLVEGDNGRGTIHFRPKWWWISWDEYPKAYPKFQGIEDAEGVFKLVVEAQQRALQS